MNNEQNLGPNELDTLVGDNHLQMMKAALPYMNVPQQRLISFFIKFNELRRTINLFEDGEVAAMGICSAGERQKSISPIDMLGAVKPFATPYEQDFIDLILNFLQGFKLAGASVDPVPSSTVPEQPVGGGSERAPENHRPAGPFGRMSFDQLKNFMPADQQSKLETMQLMMSAMQQMN